MNLTLSDVAKMAGIKISDSKPVCPECGAQLKDGKCTNNTCNQNGGKE